MKSKNRNVWIIVGVIVLIAMGAEFSDMAMQTSFGEALLSIILLTALVLGAAYWIRRSRK
jgi:uncharacterized membrane protein